MIDPKSFVSTNTPQNMPLKDIEGTFTCPEPGCFEIMSSGKYDSENKKVYWVCPAGHDGEARLAYE